MKINTYFILSLCIMGALFVGCDGNGGEENEDNFDVIIIGQADGVINESECVKRGLDGKVLMLESKYCGHCQETLPIFKAAASDAGVEPIILDLADPLHRKVAEDYGVMAQYTPTFIYDCKYVVGKYDREFYDQMFDEVVNEK